MNQPKKNGLTVNLVLHHHTTLIAQLVIFNLFIFLITKSRELDMMNNVTVKHSHLITVRSK